MKYSASSAGCPSESEVQQALTQTGLCGSMVERFSEGSGASSNGEAAHWGLCRGLGAVNSWQVAAASMGARLLNANRISSKMPRLA